MLHQKMLDLMNDVNDQVAERTALVEAIAIALLTRKNLFILGAPGQAKSFAINQFRARITGARQFERLLSKQTDEDQLFGRIDLSSLIPGSIPDSALKNDPIYEKLHTALQQAVDALPTAQNGAAFAQVEGLTEKLSAYRKAAAALCPSEPVVQTSGKIPEADICFLDEIFKCNDGVLNSLLTALNERKYTNEGRTYPIPTVSFFAASNEIPNFSDPQEKILEALYDRLELKIMTQNIEERSNRLAVLRNKQAGRSGGIAATITLGELEQMQEEVAAINVPDAINELADDILCELRKNNVRVSDRKYLNYYPIAQAKAWLSGHTQVEAQDLLALQNYLWDSPGDYATVDAVLNRLCINPLQDKANNILAMAAEARADFEAASADTTKGNAGSKALIKLRGELIRLYSMQQELLCSAQTDAEQAMMTKLLDELENTSKKAHESMGFTYAPLAQLAQLQ